MSEIVYHLIDSVYTFTQPNDIIEEFNSTEESTGCCLKYEDTHFHLECPKQKSNQAQTTLLKIYNQYIEKEALSKLADGFELPKIYRPEVSRICDDPGDIYDAVAYTDDQQSADEEPPDPEKILITHESITKAYPISAAFNTEVLRKLETFSRCTTEVSEERKQILVKADNMEDIMALFSKLTVISESHTKRISRISSFEFFIHEKQVDFKLAFGSPGEIIDRRMSHYGPGISSEYVVLIMVRWNVVDGYKSVRSFTHTLAATEDAIHPWTDFVYQSLGDEHASREGIMSISTKQHGYLVADKVNALISWRESLPPESMDAFETKTFEESPSIPVAPTKQRPEKDYVKSKRVIKVIGQPPKTQSIDDSKNTVPAHPPIEFPQIPPIEISPVEDAGNMGAIAPHSNTTALGNPLYRKGLLIDHPEQVLRAPIPIPPPDKAVLCFENAQTVDQQGHHEGSHVSPIFKDMSETPFEKLQVESEVDTRQYRREVPLKASKNSRSDHQEVPLIQRITKAVSSLLEVTRTSYGRVSLEAAIGRIYVKRIDLDRDVIDKVFGQAEWRSAFKLKMSGHNASTLFSSTLTSSWVDANFILNLKLASGKPMFLKPPAAGRVVYVLKCINTYCKKEYTVEVEANGTNEIYEIPNLVGSVNLHFPKRTWDASIRINEAELAKLNPKDSIRLLVDNLWVRSGNQAALGGRLVGPEVKVINVQVRRQSYYPSAANSDLRLSLIEVQDLILPVCAPQEFFAYATTEEEMIADDNRIWWEASVSSIAADNVLRENQSLELGEVAKWTLDDITGMSIIEEMFELAQRVVTRIDNVGCGTQKVHFPQHLPSISSSVARSKQTTEKKDRFLDLTKEDESW